MDTEQDKRRWLVFEEHCVGAVYEPDELQLVFLDPFKNTDEARRDPANVLNVAAYPGVVEAAKAVLFMPSPLTDEYHELTDGELKRLLALEIALSDVHPAEGGKT